MCTLYAGPRHSKQLSLKQHPWGPAGPALTHQTNPTCAVVDGEVWDAADALSLDPLLDLGVLQAGFGKHKVLLQVLVISKPAHGRVRGLQDAQVRSNSSSKGSSSVSKGDASSTACRPQAGTWRGTRSAGHASAQPLCKNSSSRGSACRAVCRQHATVHGVRLVQLHRNGSGMAAACRESKPTGRAAARSAELPCQCCTFVHGRQCMRLAGEAGRTGELSAISVPAAGLAVAV